MEYTHEDAVADGVNVGYDVYRIETEISGKGATLKKEPGLFVPHRDRRTKAKQYKELDDDVNHDFGTNKRHGELLVRVPDTRSNSAAALI